MDQDLKKRFLGAVMRFRKTGPCYPPGCDINLSEFLIMKKLTANGTGCGVSVRIDDLKAGLYISKPAVSQLLHSLVNKGYAALEKDADDRRRIAVSATPSGLATIQKLRDHFDAIHTEMIRRLGDRDAETLIALLERLADITDDLRHQASRLDG